MRLFTDRENVIMQELVQYKEKGDLQNLQVARLLRTKLEFLALKWSVTPYPDVNVYSVSDGDDNKALRLYFDIADFIFFIQELNNKGFIKLLSIPSKKNEKTRILFDREKYIYVDDKDQFHEKGLDEENGILSLLKDFKLNLFGKHNDVEYVNPLIMQSVPNSFAYDLENIVYQIIYPMPIMVEYVANGFKTIEDKRFEENFRLALRANKLSYWTIGISSLALIASAVSCYITYNTGNKQIETPTEISNKQFNQLDSIIQANSIKQPVNVMCLDTITVKTIDKK